MQNQNNHSFMSNGKNNSNMVQMNNMGPLNGMNYNNASRQYHNTQHQVNIEINSHELLQYS